MNLLQSTSFRTTIKCSLPGDGVDVRKPFQFAAKFKIMDQQEWEDQIENTPKSEMLAKVLEEVGPEVEGGTVKDENGNERELTPLEVVCFHPITCDAAFMHYHLYLTKDSRDSALNASQRKNSRRSRG